MNRRMSRETPGSFYVCAGFALAWAMTLHFDIASIRKKLSDPVVCNGVNNRAEDHQPDSFAAAKEAANTPGYTPRERYFLKHLARDGILQQRVWRPEFVADAAKDAHAAEAITP